MASARTHADLDNALEKPRVFDRVVLGEKHLQIGGDVGIALAPRDASHAGRCSRSNSSASSRYGLSVRQRSGSSCRMQSLREGLTIRPFQQSVSGEIGNGHTKAT